MNKAYDLVYLCEVSPKKDRNVIFFKMPAQNRNVGEMTFHPKSIN